MQTIYEICNTRKNKAGAIPYFTGPMNERSGLTYMFGIWSLVLFFWDMIIGSSLGAVYTFSIWIRRHWFWNCVWRHCSFLMQPCVLCACELRVETVHMGSRAAVAESVRVEPVH